MKKYFYILIGMIYFVSLYILKEGFLDKELTKFINTYISLEKIYYVSFILVIILVITSIINKVFKTFEQRQAKKSLSKHLLPILNKIAKIIVWVLGIITIVSNLGYNVGALLAGAGVGGLALALASQKTVANIFGAVNVLINRPFEIGDRIKISSYEGEVEDIGLIYLKIRNTEGNLVLIPNETITSSAVENFTRKK
ncbi:MAG: mechanosensitive ion channel family protein [Candidatus Altimarinota bacterium]